MLTNAQLIAAMLDAAAPVIKHYWTDLRHDARLIADAPEGSAFLWAPYESGTRIVLLSRGTRPNVRAASIFNAMNDRTLQWHYVGGEGLFAPVSTEDACTSAWGATRRAERDPSAAVSELHM